MTTKDMATRSRSPKSGAQAGTRCCHGARINRQLTARTLSHKGGRPPQLRPAVPPRRAVRDGLTGDAQMRTTRVPTNEATADPAAPTLDPERGRPLRAAGRRMVGSARQVPHPAPDRAGPAGLPARRDAAALPAAAARGMRPLTGLGLLDIGCGGGLISRAPGAPGRTGDGPRSGSREYRGGPPPRRRPGARRSTYRSGACGGSGSGGPPFDAVVCLEVVEHVPDARGVPEELRHAGAAGRPDAALDHQPHAQGLSAGHRGRRVSCCAGCRSARINGSASSRRRSWPDT